MSADVRAAIAAILCLCLATVAQAADPIIEKQNCFHDQTVEYDTWLGRLKQGNPELDPYFDRMTSREEFERYKRELDCQWILYASSDGLLVNGYMMVPAQARAEGRRLPVIIYNRGGNTNFGAMTFGRLLNEFAPLALRGYVVIGSQYRGLRSSLMGPTPDLGRDEFGGKDVDDVMALFGIIDSLPYADPKRIGLYGWSRGGMESFLVARRTPRVSAMVVGGPLLDFADVLEYQ